MYKHILIPTDGSELSKLALEEGVALAKALDAQVTIITVTTPFHVITGNPVMLTDTPERYAEHMATIWAIPGRRKKDCGSSRSRVRFGTY
jgi:nucleotide-binding universal stress UspA family protein